MQIITAKDYEGMSASAAQCFIDVLDSNPSAVLGLATGSTPIGLYNVLAEQYEAGHISFANVTTFNLDEYIGLAPTNDQSYCYFMQKNLFDRVDIKSENTHVPCGECVDTEAECADYERAIEQAGGIDIQLLGIGHNGHVGFNEPCDNFPVRTHVVDLTPSTIEANSRFFASLKDVPKQAVTMGIGTIMKAKRIVLVASGSDKAEIIEKTLFGPVTPQLPASVLQLHPDVTVILDEDAASKIPANVRTA